MTRSRSPDDKRADPRPSKPSEFTAIAPDFSGKVTNRPTPTGATVDEFDRAVEAKRQADS